MSRDEIPSVIKVTKLSHRKHGPSTGQAAAHPKHVRKTCSSPVAHLRDGRAVTFLEYNGFGTSDGVMDRNALGKTERAVPKLGHAKWVSIERHSLTCPSATPCTFRLPPGPAHSRAALRTRSLGLSHSQHV